MPTVGQAEERFSGLADYSTDMVLVIDKEGILLYANPASADMFGIALGQVLGTDAFTYVHADDRGPALARHLQLLESPDVPLRQTLRVVSASGEIRLLETVARNCLGHPGIGGIVVNGRDVTEQNRYLDDLELSLQTVTDAVATAVELRDPFTAGHQRDVAELAAAIATRLGFSQTEVKGIRIAANLHDIGKIALPAEILSSPRQLTAIEFELVKTHAEAGYHIVENVPFTWPVANVILQHHERMDGSGYPYGLVGDDILIETRIISAADVVSAMSAHRPYRQAPGIAAALAELRENRGRLYDADVVDVCQEVLSPVAEGRVSANVT